MQRKIIEIPIVRNNFDKTRSAKYKGRLEIVTNEHGVIYDWKITFSFLEIDLYTTGDWFKKVKKNKIFKYREDLFSILNLKQEPRPTRSSNKLIQLSKAQISLFENFINDRRKYDSTVGIIVGVIKGNNPGGQASKPESAEMVIEGKCQAKNFVILIDDLMMKYNDYFDSWAINAETITLDAFTELNEDLKRAFNYMQKRKDREGFSIYLKNIKEYYKKYNSCVEEAERLADAANRKYKKNITKNVRDLPFGFTSSKEFQHCHIYERHVLRDKIIQVLYKGEGEEKYKKYVDMIKDHNNFLPLIESVHRQFDRDIFTYKPNGEVYAVNDEGYEFIKTIDDKFKRIPEFFLTKERRKYLELRNEEINW